MNHSEELHYHLQESCCLYEFEYENNILVEKAIPDKGSNIFGKNKEHVHD